MSTEAFPFSDPPVQAEPRSYPRNGLGMTSLILGILGVLAGLGTITFALALVLGVIGTVLGAVGRARSQRDEATNPRQASIGLWLSVISIVLGLLGGVYVYRQLTDALEPLRQLQLPTSSQSSPSSGELQQKYLDCINALDPNDPDYTTKMEQCSTP